MDALSARGVEPQTDPGNHQQKENKADTYNIKSRKRLKPRKGRKKRRGEGKRRSGGESSEAENSPADDILTSRDGGGPEARSGVGFISFPGTHPGSIYMLI